MNAISVFALKQLKMHVSLCLYVNDMLILGTNIEIMKSTKRMLSNSFDVKDLGVVDVILRIKIIRTPDESVYLNLTTWIR